MTVEAEIRELEQRYWDALKEKDVDTIVALTDDPCTVVGAQGVGTLARKDFPKMMENATYTVDKVRISDVTVRRVGTHVAVAAYKVHEELTVDGEPVELDAADSSVWVRRDGSWVCTLHTEALKGDPFGRDRRAQG
jgi:uncharacterized protein (TIGR02246 family)